MATVDLPIHAKKDELLAAIRDHQVVIVAGETGSGKSTQLPKLCLELGRASDGRLVGHTQPRRLAARTIAERVAEELETTVGGLVGYQVRFTDRVGDGTRLKLMTDGILLAEIQRDRMLRKYDTLIIDEAHERSLNIDFILGYLRQLLPRRLDLKVIVTSATIDTERFSQHFGGAPVVEVSGRTYPVETRYRPLQDEERGVDVDQTQAICDAVRELAGEGRGDVLVFLSGEREIRDTADAVRAMDLPDTETVPLYARLSAAEQHRVFQPHTGRRVVLATNVAETSLTVPGIRYVVDPGTARISRYSRRTKVQRLPIEAVSQASANQRAGRCGRVAPGICIRLYSEDDFAGRPEFTEPEILRTNLASVILQMAAIGLGDVASFPFVDPPDARNVKDGVALLEELGALDPSAAADDRKRLTPLGRKLAQLPLDPRLGRMVIEAERNGCVRELMVIAAALSIQDPRERPADQQQAAAEKHARFADKDSDFLSYLKLWDHLREQQKALSSNQFRKLCKAEFVNYLRVREWQDIYSQLRQTARSIGLHVHTEAAAAAEVSPAQVHLSLLAGLLSHLGMRVADKQEYLGARNVRFAIAPGSALSKRPPRWVMAAELVETNRTWARVVTRIQPEWAERVGAHLVKRSYTEPHWDAVRGAAMTYERVTLYGLPLVVGRKVPHARVDAAGARELFVWNALVEGDWQTHHAFFHDNRKLLDEVRALEDRFRRRDILVGHEALYSFYDSRLPAGIVSARAFDQWWKDERARQPDLLRFSVDMLVDPSAAGGGAGAGVGRLADDYPDVWPVPGLSQPLRLSYEFEPGSPSDGVTVHVPLAVLNQVDASAGFDWQVPGLREELVTALIRSLPKPLRRNFVPVPDYARAFLERVPSHGDGPLLDVLAIELGRMTGDPVPLGSWQLDKVPDHVKMAFVVEDEDGGVVARGRDLDALKASLQGRMRATIASVVAAPSSAPSAGSRTWTFGALPRVAEVERGGHLVRAYPALVDDGSGDAVTVRMLPSEEEQAQAMWAGTRRLLLLQLPSPARALDRLLTNETKLAIASGPYEGTAAFVEDCVACAVDSLMAAAGGPAWDEAGFAALSSAVRDGLVDTTVEVGTLVGRVLVAARAVARRLDEVRAAALQPAVADMRSQLARLVFPGFVRSTGAARLRDLLRYLDAIGRRLDKLASDTARDADRMRRVQQLEHEYDDLRAALPRHHPPADVDAVRWMLEELRVSYFAQSLGTAGPVSEERITKALDRIAASA
jgi:ATP-dependent helicase HrpA